MKRYLILSLSFAMVSCSMETIGPEGGWFEADVASMDRISGVPVPGQGHGGGEAGVITAGEWKDLDDWPFWASLMNGNYAEHADRWGFHTQRRVAVKAVDAAGKPVRGAEVRLLSGKERLWTAVTDHNGRADCWIGLFNRAEAAPQSLRIEIGGMKFDETPVISGWDMEKEPVLNVFRIERPYETQDATRSADIVFIVDATGSMSDEINFLKEDLLDILDRASALSNGVRYRVGALFYRDEGDDYLTRPCKFTRNFRELSDFIGKQRASGGGDYPEAVHTALEETLRQFDWNGTSRIAFMILDAPAHEGARITESLHQSIERFAKLGIRLIPVAASGVDKSTEFMLRFFAVSTGGTYCFITNDSGVGNPHIEASVGQYQVEKLNELILRLIQEYTS